MSYQVYITSTAEHDIMRAADYIEFTLKNPDVADNLLDAATEWIDSLADLPQKFHPADDPILASWGIRFVKINNCNGVQREHNKKLNNGLPILHKVPPKRDYGRYFCIMAEKGGTSHGGLTEKLSPFFHAKKQEVNAYGR